MRPANNVDCRECRHRQKIEWSEHSRCLNLSASPTVDEGGRKRGRVVWPIYFDVSFILACKGFAPIETGGVR